MASDDADGTIQVRDGTVTPAEVRDWVVEYLKWRWPNLPDDPEDLVTVVWLEVSKRGLNQSGYTKVELRCFVTQRAYWAALDVYERFMRDAKGP